MTTLVQALQDGFAALGLLLGRMHGDIGWRQAQVGHAGTWGTMIYVQETRDTTWRIKRIDSAGLLTLSYSTDALNAGLTAAQAWTVKEELAYL